MRVIDCFPYFNEKELLELRINLLSDHVDKFIIVDADHTHSGIPKSFTCVQTLNELGILTDKIQVIELNLPSYIEENCSWVRERMQRNVISNYIEDGDICIISDCDEIINPNLIEYYTSVSEKHPQNILRIPLIFLMGRGDLRVYDESHNPVSWNTPFICLHEHLKKYTLSDIRESYALSTHHIDYSDIFITENNIIEDAGWHFSWMGDITRIKIKEESFLHWNEVSVKNNYVAEENKTDCLGRKDHILKKYPIELLPQKIFDLDRVRNFLQLKKQISVVQIGTNKSYDDLSKHLISNYENLNFGLFVEPNLIFNDKIEKCYEKFENISIENIAIVPQNFTQENEIEIFYHTGDPTLETTSCIKEHLIKHEQYYSDGEIKSFKVPCMTLTELFEKYSIKNLDWLLLDIEGIDAEVILTFNWESYNIKRIEFEYIHLGIYTETIERKFYNMGYKKVVSLHEFDWAFEK